VKLRSGEHRTKRLGFAFNLRWCCERDYDTSTDGPGGSAAIMTARDTGIGEVVWYPLPAATVAGDSSSTADGGAPRTPG
jgi:hypothetical protein